MMFEGCVARCLPCVSLGRHDDGECCWVRCCGFRGGRKVTLEFKLLCGEFSCCEKIVSLLY